MSAFPKEGGIHLMQQKNSASSNLLELRSGTLDGRVPLSEHRLYKGLHTGRGFIRKKNGLRASTAVSLIAKVWKD